MSEPYRAFSAVLPIITRKEGGTIQILLHRRQNTGFMDGLLDIAASGHVDEGETAMQATVRECKEELGIDVRLEDLTFAHLQHTVRNIGRTYYNISFAISNFIGVPSISEPDKCTEILWCDINNLPTDMIESRRAVVQEYAKGSLYSEWVENREEQ